MSRKRRIESTQRKIYVPANCIELIAEFRLQVQRPRDHRKRLLGLAAECIDARQFGAGAAISGSNWTARSSATTWD